MEEDDELETLLEIIESQKTCEDIGDICNIKFTSFGWCCIKCGYLPVEWSDV